MADLTARKYGSRFFTPSAAARNTAAAAEQVANDLGDFGAAAQQAALALSQRPDDNDTRTQVIVNQAFDHDLSAASAGLWALPRPAPGDRSIEADLAKTRLAQGAAVVAYELGDWAVMKKAFEAFDLHQLPTQFALIRRTVLTPFMALTDAKLGDFAEADRQIAATPLDCYLCVRMRAQVAEAKHDWPAADRWFAEAVRQGPSIPAAYAEWGEALLAKGDAVGAIAKLQLAHEKGPHFADPLELWGEALMRKGDFAGAVAKFTEADKYAPHWGRNHLRWGEALARLGRTQEAATQWRTAARLALSTADRAELARLQAHG